MARHLPESGRDGRELSVLLLLLGKVRQTGEEEHGYGQEHEQQAQLLVALVERVAEALQAGGVARQLEDAQDPEHAEEREHAPEPVRLLHQALQRLVVEQQRDVEGQDRDQVDDVEGSFQELGLVRR